MHPFIYIVIVLLLFSERIHNTFATRKEENGRRFDNWIIYTLLIGYLCSVIAIIIEHFISGVKINASVLIMGSLVLSFGIYLRRQTIKELGRYWSLYIKIIPGQKIISTGPYKYLSHPYCIGVACELVGFAIVSGSFYSLAGIVVIMVPLLIVRAILEEKVLKKEIGVEYIRFKTKRRLL